MTSNLGIYRSANGPIREHGALRAPQRADAMLERGDIEGAAVWRRIVKGRKNCSEPSPGQARRHTSRWKGEIFPDAPSVTVS